ncbi:MAG: glycosyltransferase family 2 protein [Candidatus Euphemobacter frigidus]|nr:glycosyltransferase family 2 protein [Candidatus Euphemobacter frigidus]MDP8276816.1 glycosyltransferase family 2 protein [Candidatus Euphemobacter frigidus]
MKEQEKKILPSVTVVIPAYNEGKTIALTVSDIRKIYPEYEILVVDDGSTDGTADRAEGEGVRVLRNSQNRGYGASLKRGILKARGVIIVTLDGDGQHDCRGIARLVEGMAESDMVVGQRLKEDQVAVRKPGKWLLTAVAQYLVNQQIPDLNSGFRAFYRTDAIKYLPLLPNGFSFTTTITLSMLKDGRDVKYLPIKINRREEGSSRVSFFRDGGKTLLLILRVIMLFNPLRIFVPLSMILIFLGGIYTLFMMVVYSNISDTTTLLLLAGIGTLFFGLLADQISNIRRGG